MSSKLYSVIDVETTGGQPNNSRITDISIFITDGHQILDEFTSLVNPGMPIPSFITQLTGIDDDMVSNAPAFEEIARSIVEITQDTTFVAHNVNFDFGMVSGEFSRLGFPYVRDKLCTVRLARKFIPGHHSYGLGNICGDLGISINGRHRARGDAEATVELFHLIYEASDGHPTMNDEKWVKCLPAHIDRKQVDCLPNEPGVYYYKDASEKVLEVGGSENLFKTVVKFLKSNSQKSKDIKSTLNSIDFELHDWSLTAMLSAHREMEKTDPVQPKEVVKKIAFEITRRFDLFGYANLEVEKVKNTGSDLSFRSKKEAEVFIKRLCESHKLCDQLSVVQIDKGCKNLTCRGACRQQETPQSYNQRVEQAFIDDLSEGENYAVIDAREGLQTRFFVLVENGDYQGMGEIGDDHTLGELSDLRELVKPETSSPVKMKTITTFIEKSKTRFKLLR